jgi:polyisoprenoid-binding protein YceI
MARGLRVLCGALSGVVLLVAWRAPGDRLTLSPESRLAFDGGSTVRNWSCSAESIDAAIEAEGGGAVAAVLQARKAVETVVLTVPVDRIDCGNGTMNGHMRKALDADAHRTIVFRLTGYDLAAGPSVAGTLRGTLTLKGVTRPIVLRAEFTTAPAGALRVKGSYPLTMTEWQVTPPTLMLGTLKVDPVVTVRFDLQLHP